MESQTLPLRSLNHVSLLCSDVHASMRFYRDVLGFYQTNRPQCFCFEGYWLFNYGIGIHLLSGVPVEKPAEIIPQSDHLSFQADSIEKVKQLLEANGFPFKSGTVVEGGISVNQVFFHDPDHNLIEVCNCERLPIVPLERTNSCTHRIRKTLNHIKNRLHK